MEKGEKHLGKKKKIPKHAIEKQECCVSALFSLLEYIIPEQSLPWPSTSSRVIVLGDFMNITTYLQRKPWIKEENEFEFAVQVSIQSWAVA